MVRAKPIVLGARRERRHPVGVTVAQKRATVLDPLENSIGAICSLPCVTAKVGLPKREQLFSVVGGNAYSCPKGDVHPEFVRGEPSTQVTPV